MRFSLKDERKKILILTPRFPYPIIGGDRLRIHRVCKALSTRFSLTLLSLCESEQEMKIEIPDDGVFNYVERVYLSPYKSYFNAFKALPTKLPLQVAYYQSTEFLHAVERLLPQHDCVLSHLIRCAEYVRYVNKPTILEMTDAISLNYSRVRDVNGYVGFKGVIYRIEANRLKAYEKAIIDDFDFSVLVSEIDKKFLVGDLHEKVIVCSNGVDLDRFRFRSRGCSNRLIVFIGNMMSAQNMDACLYFAKEVMPLICENSDAKFRVVGKISKANLSLLKTFPNVEVTGEVEDVAAAVADATVGVCPVRIGAGIQNKILEYMAMGIPVVSSTTGLEGLKAVEGKDLLLADSSEEYVRQIEYIWNNPDFSLYLGKNGRSYVEKHHKWSVLMQPLLDGVSSLIN